MFVKDSIASCVESATNWARDKPHARETIAGVVQDNLENSAPVVQLTSAPVSSDCKQVNQLTPATALVGDRLAIRVFEREALKPATISVGTSPLYFERQDLSGRYEVDAQGEVSLPLVGRVKAEGRSISCLEAVIAARHTETFSMSASVSAAFASRAPVLVAGAVRAEGTYNYTQGMTLRHVLALAGASPSQSTRAADIALMARKEELDDLMATKRLKMLALASARAGSASLPMNEVQHIADNYLELAPLPVQWITAATLLGVYRQSQIRLDAERVREIAHLKAVNERFAEEVAKLDDELWQFEIAVAVSPGVGAEPVNTVPAKFSAIEALVRLAALRAAGLQDLVWRSVFRILFIQAACSTRPTNLSVWTWLSHRPRQGGRRRSAAHYREVSHSRG